MNKVKEAFPEFEKPSVAIDTVVLRVKDYEIVSNRQMPRKRMQVLLVKKDNEKQWHLPGTILRLGETPKDSIKRIINDKVNFGNVSFEQLYTVADNPFRDERGHIVSIVYIGMLNNSDDIIEHVNKSEYKSQWFWIGYLEKDTNIRRFTGEDTNESFNNMMYDHDKIVSDTVQRLKGKLLYSDIGFNFIGEMFTLKDLENTFNAINERDIAGFRRIIANKVEETGIISKGKAFRPAELYRKKNKHIV